MAYLITEKCLKCGVCIDKCPAGAIIAGEDIVEYDGFILHPVSIALDICTDCGVCVSEEFWCPAQAIVKV